MSSLNPVRQNALLLIALLFAQLLLMSGSVQESSGSTLLETSVLRISRPVVALARMTGGGVRGLWTGMRELTIARKENAALREELVRVRGELDRYREESLENERLRQLLGMKRYLAPASVGARVVTATISNQEHVIVVNRGTGDGVLTDQAVVAWGGAVGRVVFAAKHEAKVRLLTDPNSSVAGVVQRSRVAGMVEGRGHGPLEMRYVPGFADVAPDDRIVTSGLDGVFPHGFGVGRVVQVSESSGVAKSIFVKPDVDFSRLEEVLVLLEPEDDGGAVDGEAEAGR